MNPWFEAMRKRAAAWEAFQAHWEREVVRPLIKHCWKLVAEQERKEQQDKGAV